MFPGTRTDILTLQTYIHYQKVAVGMIYLFGVLIIYLGFYVAFNTVQVTTGSWKGRGNQYIEFARVLYCKLPTNGKQLPAFPHRALTGIEPRPQRWEARVLLPCYQLSPGTNYRHHKIKHLYFSNGHTF